ncbi:hypothetical protein ACHAWT_000419 [Skeletonema menzelii]
MMVSAPVHIDGHDDMGRGSTSTAEIALGKPDPLPAPSMTRVPSAPKLTEAKSLESESKDLLGRVGITGAARRCAEYKPTLDELKETSFSDYIRGEVLGVPLPGFEFLYIHEDNKGRETKREVPLGQVPPPNYVEPTDSPTPVNAKPQTPASPKQPVAGANSPSEKMKTRSQSKSSGRIKKGSQTTKLSTPEPKKYQMCRYKLRDGMARVSLPPGFWAKLDSSARGRHWAKGSKLGDMIIPSPIKQMIAGIGGVYEYTLVEQPPISVSDFRIKADEYRKRHVGKEFDEDDSDEACDELARKYWRRMGPTMEPPTYGADMSGTLFKDAHACGWNVDRLESCLCLLRADAQRGDSDDEVFHLPGVTSAYLYFGMWGSTFAAHAEDMNLLSINYLHAGSPKYWYGIAQEDSRRFESLARSHFPGRAAECNEFLRHKQCLLSPSILKKAGIKFTTTIQRPGDAMITFPGCYHFGFNTGFNVAESTNFAVPEWVPLGEAADVCMCHPHSVRIEMKRLKSLLNDYDKDMLRREDLGQPDMTYTNWAKQEARRLKKEMRSSANQKGTAIDGYSSDSFQLPKTFGKCIAVEVTREMSTNKKNKRKSYKKEEVNEWRLAKRARPGAFTPNTNVICLVECEEDESADGYEFFIGTIVKQVDGHVKVHFTGLGRKDDAWFEQESENLLLDAGATDPPPLSDDDDSENETLSKVASKKDQHKKKRKY